MVLDESVVVWYVVCKNPTSKLTEVYRLDNGISNLLFTTDFWSGISDANFGKLVLHGFVAPDRPEPMGISVYHGQTGQEIWSRQELIYQQSLNENEAVAIAKNHETFQYLVLDSSTGETLKTVENAEEIHEIMAPLKLNSAISTVSVYREGEENFEVVKQFILNKEQKTITGLVEYLETDRLIVISYYIRASNGFVNVCSFYDLEGNLLAKENLAEKAEQLALNTFMVHKQTIVLIKERKEVVFYEV